MRSSAGLRRIASLRLAADFLLKSFFLLLTRQPASKNNIERTVALAKRDATFGTVVDDPQIATWLQDAARADRYRDESRRLAGKLDANRVARTLLASAAAFDFRWPELYSGSELSRRPAPYPASCRPQAWSAASAAVLMSVALGFEPDAASGQLTLHPSRPSAFGAMTVRGLHFAGRSFGVECHADGSAQILDLPPDLDIHIA